MMATGTEEETVTREETMPRVETVIREETMAEEEIMEEALAETWTVTITLISKAGAGTDLNV
jgi:hypothetical protein